LRAARIPALPRRARTVASLDHVNIVPVYDVGSTLEQPVFIVSKFIEGSTLRRKSSYDRPQSIAVPSWWRRLPRRCTTRIIGPVASRYQARNILPRQVGRAVRGRFGLAIKREDIGTGPR